MPYWRIAWYSQPTFLSKDPTPRELTVPIATRIVPTNTPLTPATLTTLLDQAVEDWRHPSPRTRQRIPHWQDIFTVGAQAYQREGPDWVPIPVSFRSSTALTAHRLPIYAMSPLAPRPPYTQADHHAIAQRLAQWLWAQGLFPVLPHLYLPGFLEDTDPAARAQALTIGHAWMTQCPLVAALDVPWSTGMRAEADLAHTLHRPIEHIPWAAIDPDHPYTLEASAKTVPDSCTEAFSPHRV